MNALDYARQQLTPEEIGIDPESTCDQCSEEETATTVINGYALCVECAHRFGASEDLIEALIDANETTAALNRRVQAERI
jgi:predicted Zn-dependent protease with MMP-like domain